MIVEAKDVANAAPDELGVGPVRILVEGTEDAPRTVVVRFEEFACKLLDLGEPDEGAERELLAGAQLIEALEAETDRFGAAAPGVPPDAGFAEKVLALTDEAFSAASELLNDSEWEGGASSLDGRTALARVVAGTLDPDLHGAVAAALMGCPPAVAADRSVGEEFV